MDVIGQLRNFDADRLDLIELIQLKVQGTALRDAIESEKVEVPEWLGAALRAVNREIGTRQQDQIERRLSEIRAQKDQLQTPAQRRAALEREEKELLAKAGA